MSLLVLQRTRIPCFMAEQVPAPPAPNQVQEVVNFSPTPAVPAPEPILAGPVARVEDRLPAVADNVAQKAAPEVTILLGLSSRVPFFFILFLAVFTLIWSSQLVSPLLSWRSRFCCARFCSRLCGSLALC